MLLWATAGRNAYIKPTVDSWIESRCSRILMVHPVVCNNKITLFNMLQHIGDIGKRCFECVLRKISCASYTKSPQTLHVGFIVHSPTLYKYSFAARLKQFSWFASITLLNKRWKWWLFGIQLAFCGRLRLCCFFLYVQFMSTKTFVVV